MSDNFTPYRDRPALDKGHRISWSDLESGMLFQPLAGAPSLRRVRGFPQFMWHGSQRTPGYLIGSEDAADGRPTGGIIGCADEFYVRSYVDGSPVYTSDSGFLVDDAEVMVRLRREFIAKLAEVKAAAAEDPEGLEMAHRLHIAENNLAEAEQAIMGTTPA